MVGMATARRASVRAATLAMVAAVALAMASPPALAGAPPTITSFSPTSGPVGTSVAINGTDFTGATSVTFNGTSAGFSVNGAGTQITATVPSGATTGPIRVTTPSGSAQSASNFTVTSAAPTISSFNPSSGAVGTSVAIHGSNFTGVNAVRFNGVSAAFTFVSDVKVKATVPSGATTGKITLTTPAGTATSSTSFTVTGPGAAPVITSISPLSGPVGSTVTIRGSNFTGVNAVRFNGVSATFAFVTDAKVTAVVPAGATTGKISLTTPAGTATSADTFTVTGPKITGFNPKSGAVGTTVTINGSRFTGVTSVAFNGVPASFTFVSDTQVRAVVPAGATTGKITLTTPAGTATSADNFTVTGPHPRTTTLSIGRRSGRGPLLASGNVSVNDGYNQCARYVPVVIKRWRFGSWRWITTTSTGPGGGFRARIPDRPGRYRARAIGIVLANGAACGSDISNVVSVRR